MSKVTLRPHGDIVRTADIESFDQYGQIAREFIESGADGFCRLESFNVWGGVKYFGCTQSGVLCHSSSLSDFVDATYKIRILTPAEILGDEQPEQGNYATATYTGCDLFITVDPDHVTIDTLNDDGAVCLTHAQLEKVFDIVPDMRELIEGD